MNGEERLDSVGQMKDVFCLIMMKRILDGVLCSR